MKDFLNKNNKEKHQFKSYYCAKCRQNKPCQLLTEWNSAWKSYCCACYYENEQERAAKYNSYEKVLGSKQKEQVSKVKQLKLLREYAGCKKCGSLEVDACSLYERNKLVCQSCLISKAGESSSPVSFLEQSKWFKNRWKIDISWWLENYGSLPVNASCAKKWLKDKEHLSNCACLEQEAKEIYELFANSLKSKGEKLKDCQCEKSEKIRVDSDYYAWCETCGESIIAASKKRVIKNRNDPRFWGLKVSEKVLCLKCLAKLGEKMPPRKKYLFREYQKRGYWK